ncbi:MULTISPECIES: hypothetical protein [Tenacibaculum]|uniref:hypothetical protein n=1 Tax=Tenacibaculum TaxID=104267 RepID=UPI001F0A5331|nr:MULTISPECIES: hypothetical protein [Tenacibaculum]MCH3882366.1 hypothetical protein [Tenacibaculum aquimarinum]MDO6600164.1 hypothetical protein [Tenacibaculum sp. 1_MG-2023]
MKNTLFYYFIFSLFTGTVIYFLQYFSVPLPRIFRFYVNDFLIIPIVLYSCLRVLKWSKNNKNYMLSLPIILYVCLLYSVLFEYVFPKYLARYTKDFMDVIVYFASGLVFYYLQKNKNEF